MPDRLTTPHLCAPPPASTTPVGTVWKCRPCGARYTRRGTSWTQTKKPRRPVWAIIRTLFDGILSIP